MQCIVDEAWAADVETALDTIDEYREGQWAGSTTGAGRGGV
jgi:hypothetical protein